ncbi:MAG TPA: Wzz/FepE/Etk N-terminal domain-containing protein [Bacillota bacterium]
MPTTQGGEAVRQAALDEEIDLVDLILPLIRGWKLLLGLVLAAGLAAALISGLMPTRYETAVRLRLVPPAGYEGSGWTPPAPAFYLQLLEDPNWLSQTAAATGRPVEWLEDHMELQHDEGAEALTLHVRADDAGAAATIANQVAAELVRWSAAVNREALERHLEARLEQLENSIATRRAQLEQTERTLWVRDAVVDDPARITALLGAEGDGQALLRAVREAGGVVLLRQEINPVWQEIALALAAEEREREQVARQLERLAAAQPEHVAALVVVIPASAPAAPAEPRLALHVAVAVLLGLMVGVLVLFGREFWQRQLAPALLDRS